MPQLDSYSTDDQPPDRRIDYWHHITGSALTTQIADPVDRQGFCGRMTCLDLGDLRIVELNASGSTVTRTRAHVGCSSDAVYLVRLVLCGEITVMQEGREVCLRPGDFTLCDTSRPYQTCFRERSDVLIIRIPRERFLKYLAQPEAVLAVLMPGQTGLSGLASRHLRELWGATPEFLAYGSSSRMIEIALQLLASAYGAVPQARADRSHRTTMLRRQILDLIERQISDPELSPTQIAEHLRITPGYLHRLFSDGSGTVSRYILRRRLEHCARVLKDPLLAHRSITAIAFASGFNSMPHFSRVFRAQYGLSPSEYRHV